MEILKQNWKEVVRMILAQYVEFIPDSKPKKQHICNLVFDPEAEGNPEQMVFNIQRALDTLDKRDRLERIILVALLSSPNGYFNAFQAISKNTRFIYIHAY